MQTQRMLDTNTATTRLLLLCGAIAGPVFTVAWLLEEIGRADYDPLLHPISSLAIGAAGWTQAANFWVTGLLVLGFAVGLRRRLAGPAGSKWAPLLIGLIGVGLIGAGCFVTAPLNGYPPGTPLLPTHYGVVGRLHRLFSAFVFLGLPGACWVFARRFGSWGERGWARFSASMGIAFVLLFVITSLGFGQIGGLEHYAGLLQRITLTVGWAWLTPLAVHVLSAPAR